MIRLEDIAAGMSIEGLEPGRIVTVSAVVPISDDSRQVFYKLPDGTLRERPITVEITAEFPQGAPDYIERGVSENANQIGFKSKDWE